MQVPKESQPRIPDTDEYVRTLGRLVEIEDVTPVQRTVLDYVFEETSARIDGRINGKTVKTYGEFNDFYGEGTCIDNAKQEAKVQAEWLGPCNMVFVVVKITARERMRPTRNQNLYAPAFVNFQALDYGCKANLPEDKEEDVWSYQCPAAKTGEPAP